MSANADIDLELWDAEDSRIMVIGLSGSSLHTVNGVAYSVTDVRSGVIIKGGGTRGVVYKYAGVEISFSGDDVSAPVKEWIKLKGKMTKPLVLKAFGYVAGTATVTYSWGGRETAGCEREIKSEKKIKKQEMDRVMNK